MRKDIGYVSKACRVGLAPPLLIGGPNLTLRLFVLIIMVLHFAIVECLTAGPPRALPPGEVPNDERLGPLKGERGDFSFFPPESRRQWGQRAGYVRRVMRVTLGLWPMPTKTVLDPVIHGLIDQGDYTIEKVCFKSAPGFYVTGNLYRPKGKTGRLPAVLSPHGHFPGGRFQDEGLKTVRRKIITGAERFEDGGRSFMQSRCVQLQRRKQSGDVSLAQSKSRPRSCRADCRAPV